MMDSPYKSRIRRRAARNGLRRPSSHILLVHDSFSRTPAVCMKFFAQRLLDQFVHPALDLCLPKTGELARAGEPGIMFEHCVPDFDSNT